MTTTTNDKSEDIMRKAIVQYILSRQEAWDEQYGVNIDDYYIQTIVPELMRRIRERAIAKRQK